MRRYLIVSNQTLGGAALAAKIRDAIAQGPSEFYVVVPSTRPRDHLVWTEGEARAIASERLGGILAWLSSIGASAAGEIADEHPLYAIRDVLRDHDIDEVIISTLPAGMSRWLKQGLPKKVEREFGLPVTHVVGEAPSKPKSA